MLRQPPPPASGIVTLLSDFGGRDPYVGIMKGAVLRGNSEATIVDLCHEVPPQDLEVGAFFLGAARNRFPAGTVHLGVIDPGVGSERRILAVCADEAYWLVPDNGLASALWLEPSVAGYEVRAVDCERLGIRPSSRTFHGRDVFGPLAGMLSRGQCGFRALGPRIEDPVELDGGSVGGAGHGGLRVSSAERRVIYVDHFGNLISNIGSEALGPDSVAVNLAGRRIPLVETYSAVGRGSLLALINSYDCVEVAVAEGSAYEQLGCGRGTPIDLADD